MRYRIPSLWMIAAVAASAPLPAPAAPQAPQAHYRIIARYAVGGNETGYDYINVDAAARRLYVAHATQVEALDADDGRKIGAIQGINGVHGIALVPALGKGYTSDGLDRAVTAFDLKTLRVLKRIKYTGVKPDAIEYDADSGRVFVVNGGASGDVTVIDPRSDAIVATVDLGGGKLEEIGFDGRGRGFVNDEQKAVIHVFDTHSLKPLTSWPLAGCEEPTGLAVDTAHRRVFSACGNGKLTVVDTDNGRLVATLPIGPDPDGAVFDPATQRLFTPSRMGTLSVLHEAAPDRYETLQTLDTEPGARTIALDPKTGRLFLPTGRFAAPPPGGGSPPLLPNTFVVLVVGE